MTESAGAYSFSKDMKRVVVVIWTLFLVSVLLSPIAWWTAIPGPGELKYFDKAAHFCLFAITGFVGVFGTNSRSQFKTRLLFAAVFSLFLAVSTELAQSPFVRSRHTDPYDLLANVIGLSVGLVLYSCLHSIQGVRSFLRL